MNRNPEDLFEASCLCGAVNFAIRGKISKTRYCHCEHCRKFAGTSPCAWGLTLAKSMTIDSDGAETRKYQSGNGARVFCGTCGSPLWYEPTALPDYRGIPLGVLDSGQLP
ncbi:MAG: GFA family protein, partial [Pseudomonadales bacterium]